MLNTITTKSIPGGWTEQRIAVGDCAFDLILPADPDEFLNQLELDGDVEAVDPYWAALWPAASKTAALVLDHDWTQGTVTLELGCGSGLVGLAGLAAGLNVTFSDLVPTAVELALENARRNGFQHARGRLVDWYHPPGLQPAVIFGSDLLYESCHHEALLNTIDGSLAKLGQCWLGDPGRVAAEEFITAAEARDFAVQLLDTEGRTVDALHPGQFRLLVLKRR